MMDLSVSCRIPGCRLVSSTQDGTVRIWSLNSDSRSGSGGPDGDANIPIGDDRSIGGKRTRLVCRPLRRHLTETELPDGIKGMVAVPDGRLLAGIQRPFTSSTRTIDHSRQGDLKAGTGSGGLFSSTPNQQLVVLDAHRATSWGDRVC